MEVLRWSRVYLSHSEGLLIAEPSQQRTCPSLSTNLTTVVEMSYNGGRKEVWKDLGVCKFQKKSVSCEGMEGAIERAIKYVVNGEFIAGNLSLFRLKWMCLGRIRSRLLVVDFISTQA